MNTSHWFPRIDSTLCIGCRECVIACRPGALAQQNGKSSLAYPALCTYCSACESICPVHAIQLPFLIRKLNPSEKDTV